MATSVASLPSVRDVFVYGTLLADEIVSIILNRIPPSVPASISDFHRHRIKGRVYPAIIPAKGHQVNGKVLFGLTDDELALLDEFEDVDYTRQIVEPMLLNGQKDGNVEANQGALAQAYVYVWADATDANLFGEWDYEEWRKKHLNDFAEICRDFVSDLNKK